MRLDSNSDIANSSNSINGRLPRTKSVRFSDGLAPDKTNPDNSSDKVATSSDTSEIPTTSSGNFYLDFLTIALL